MRNSKFSELYLYNNQVLEPFLQFPYPDFNMQEVIEKRRKIEVNRSLLCEYLLSYHAELPYFEITSKQIEKLKNPNTFTVCTGQQAGLYGGPLFTWYKAIYAILYTRKLKNQYPEFDFIPIFFIASEDHDIKEVKRAWINYHDCVEYPHFHYHEVTGRHIIRPFNKENVPAWADLFWIPGEQWKYAFSKLLLTYLGKYGLILFDPDNSKLKREFISILENALEGSHFPLLSDQTQKLEKTSGIRSPLNPRQINLFYIDENNHRYGIIKKNSKYIAGPYKWSEKEMFQSLFQNPQAFSPSAALRPLFQEYFLPNLIYIGGWTEIHYWLQLKPLFDFEKIFFPVLIPRPSILFFKKEHFSKWKNQFHLEPKSVLLSEHEVIHLYFKKFNSYQKIDKKTSELLDTFSNYMEKLYQIDPLLKGYTNHIHKKVSQFSKNICKRHIKHLINWHFNQYKEILSLKQAIQPNGFIQERSLSILHFSSPESLIKQIMNSSLEEGIMNIIKLSI